MNLSKNNWLENYQVLPQPLVLDIEEWNKVFITSTWENWEQEKKLIQDFLRLTDYEKKLVWKKLKEWYILLWSKQKWWLYPEYFRLFHDENLDLFSWSQEDLVEITWYRELIFIKFNVWIGISQDVSEPIKTFSDVVRWILQL